MLQNDSPHDDFAAHFYLTRYEHLKGLLMVSPEHVRTAAKKAFYDATGKNQYELPLFQDEGKNAMAWSMNWYRLRTPDNKTYQLTDDDKANIISDYKEIGKSSPLKTQIHIFQSDNSDTLLIAVSFILE
jgi:histone acetyltransferase (RNA polymerase elongator complex component)